MCEIKTVAFGTTYTSDDVAYKSVSVALEEGYEIFNTCAAYKNLKGMGRALSEVPRESIKIIALDSNEKRSSIAAESFDGYTAEMRQIFATLEDLRTDYLDMFIVNWPVPRYMENVWQKLNADTWRAMEECVNKGLIKQIGVSNFLQCHLETLKKTAQLPIAVNQLEIHPNFQQKELVQYCQNSGVEVQAWSPLFKGKAVQIPTICEIAQKYAKSPAQIVLRWNIQNRILPIVCSSVRERIRENRDIFDFALTEEDMRQIDLLESGEHVDVYSYQRQQESLRWFT